jgi:hypothetical protein
MVQRSSKRGGRKEKCMVSLVRGTRLLAPPTHGHCCLTVKTWIQWRNENSSSVETAKMFNTSLVPVLTCLGLCQGSSHTCRMLKHTSSS